MQNLQALLKLLVHSPIEFVLIGGFAAVLHGCDRTTRDIDICILSSPEQIRLLQDLLKPYHPSHRQQNSQFSFLDEMQDLSKPQDFHLNTDLGALDVIHHIQGVGDYYDALKNSEEIEIYGAKCRLISLEDLIQSKKLLGRYRDIATLMELEAIRKLKNKS